MSDGVSFIIYLATNKSLHNVVQGLVRTLSTKYKSMKEIPERKLSEANQMNASSGTDQERDTLSGLEEEVRRHGGSTKPCHYSRRKFLRGVFRSGRCILPGIHFDKTSLEVFILPPRGSFNPTQSVKSGPLRVTRDGHRIQTPPRGSLEVWAWNRTKKWLSYTSLKSIESAK